MPPRLRGPPHAPPAVVLHGQIEVCRLGSVQGVKGLGFGNQGSGFGDWGSGFRVWGLGFRVRGLGVWVSRSLALSLSFFGVDLPQLDRPPVRLENCLDRFDELCVWGRVCVSECG